MKQPVEIFSLNKGNKRDYLLPFKIARVVRKVRPHIVHTRNWAAIDGVIGAKLAGVRSVIHGEHGREASDPIGANIIRKKVRKGLSPWISEFVTVSSELRNWLIHDVGIPEKKVIQIINGVDTEKFKPSENKEMSKSKLGIVPDSFIIGTVGRLDPVKDYQTLIKAFATLTTNTYKINKIKLLITGSGSEEQRLKTLSEDVRVADRVYFLGERQDIPELMQCMDVFVLPSIAEGISNTILEAMACGLPVITTKIGGNPELVDDGKTGFLFTSRDHIELADKLSFYCDNFSILMEHGLNARVRTEERFSLSRMIRDYDELYSSIADF